MSFDKRLKALRLKNEMTQDYVARRLNVARSTIAGYETKNRQPSHEKLTALANLFHVSIDYLLEGEESITLTPSQSVPEPVTERNFLERYRSLSPESKRDVLKCIHLLELRDAEQAGS
ncbi:helix-turn-helix domain-containing protein [Dorea sp. D27]|uniref:helix-turn-helix domain-containing protein n=1 Tax=Dorea sp. D27 TaxID=658665 RepID=UPI0006739B10|nr:helix-turn-helix transcriptional regulator [Dorea sp. D27]KMZ53450.1 toxin-antitoxin system, antitoxin component, Xre family [Dorea sp. D27]